MQVEPIYELIYYIYIYNIFEIFRIQLKCSFLKSLQNVLPTHIIFLKILLQLDIYYNDALNVPFIWTNVFSIIKANWSRV